MCFVKKHKKGLKKMQASNVKARSVMEAFVRPKMPKGPSGSCLALNACPKLGKWIRSYMAKAHRLCQPKPKAEASAPA